MSFILEIVFNGQDIDLPRLSGLEDTRVGGKGFMHDDEQRTRCYMPQFRSTDKPRYKVISQVVLRVANIHVDTVLL